MRKANEKLYKDKLMIANKERKKKGKKNEKKEGQKKEKTTNIVLLQLILYYCF